MASHKVSWKMSITINGSMAEATYTLLANSKPDSLEVSEKGDLKVHRKGIPGTPGTNFLSIEYEHEDPANYAFSWFQFEQDTDKEHDLEDFHGGLNFPFAHREVKNTRTHSQISFRDDRKSYGTWKLIFWIRDNRREYRIHPEITNTDLEGTKKP